MSKLSGRNVMRALAVLFACISIAAHAQPAPARPGGYPTKPIRLLVGNAPGGGIDITARVVGQKLTERWGRPVVVDNRPGASGVIAMDVTAQAASDGYTLLVTSGSLHDRRPDTTRVHRHDIRPAARS